MELTALMIGTLFMVLCIDVLAVVITIPRAPHARLADRRLRRQNRTLRAQNMQLRQDLAQQQ